MGEDGYDLRPPGIGDMFSAHLVGSELLMQLSSATREVAVWPERFSWDTMNR